MPELPEVETVKNGLEPYILHQKILDVEIYRYDLRRNAPDNAIEVIKDRKVTGLSRRSKYLFIHLDNGKTLITHLGMSGTLTVQPNNTAKRKHDHFILYVNECQIHFNDPRRFGFFDVQPTSCLEDLIYIKNLGYEPFDQNLKVDNLFNIMRNKSQPIKNFLMDNAHIVGIGNIYACEILFDVKISPFRPTKNIKIQEVKLLLTSIRKTLKNAIKSGGSSLKDHKQVSGKLGYFQHNFKVYNRENLPCTKCNNLILRDVQSARSTFYCAHCQKS